MTVATVLYINELPQLQSAPVTVLARLRDGLETPVNILAGAVGEGIRRLI